VALDEQEVGRDTKGPAAEPGRDRWGLAGRPAAPLAILASVTLVDAVDTSILRGVLTLIEEEPDETGAPHPVGQPAGRDREVGIGLGGLVGGAFGWPWAFALVGMPGSLVAFLVFRMREPIRGEAEGIVVPEAAAVPLRELSRTALTSLLADLKMIFGIRTMRYVLIGVSTLLFTVNGVGYWLAVYHERYSDMTEVQAAGTAAGVLAVAGIIGTLWGGRLSDRVFGVSPAGRITQSPTPSSCARRCSPSRSPSRSCRCGC
jgi:MFS family permease